MIGQPAWFTDEPEFAADKAAHAQICSGAVDAAFAHRAARHHNWRQSDTAVQNWTMQAHQDAQRDCTTECWRGMRAVNRPRNAEFVTHTRVHYFKDPALKARILESIDDSDGLRRAAVEWHKDLRDSYPDGTLWLGERTEVDAGRPFDANNLHAIVAELGLWHFGELNADPNGVVLRLTYRIEDDVQLYKPDWRHGYPYFYFAAVPGVTDHGFTRDLGTGNLQRKEWIAHISEIEPRRHLLAAQCIKPIARHCHYDLPDLYWQTLAGEIKRQASSVP